MFQNLQIVSKSETNSGGTDKRIFGPLIGSWRSYVEEDTSPPNVGSIETEAAVFRPECINIDALNELDKRKQILTIQKMRNITEPLARRCKKTLDLIEASKKYSALNLTDVVGLAHRIAPHVRAPPEYWDPSGRDRENLIPGFLFPCPDRAMMQRAWLYHHNIRKAMPPKITFQKDKQSASIVRVNLRTLTEGGLLFYGVNTGPWQPYNAAIGAKPFLTGPGKYLVKGYCQAPGLLHSEVSMEEIELPGPSSEDVAQTDLNSFPLVKASDDDGPERPPAPKKSAFSGLLLGSLTDESDDDSNDET